MSETPNATLDEVIEMARADGHPVIEVNATRGYEGTKSPYIIIRDGDRVALVNPLGFDDHLSIDVRSYDAGAPVTASAFGMTLGRQVDLPATGFTSHGRPSAPLVAVLIGEQGKAEPEPDLRAHCREFHPRIVLRGQANNVVADAHATDHHRRGSTTHHHGPNAGAHARPAGWRTGGGVVRLDPAKRLLRHPGKPAKVTRAWSESNRPGPSAPPES
jgi:hypothetical protein